MGADDDENIDKAQQRFRDLHRRFKEKFGEGHLVKLIALVLGLLLLLIGVLLLFLPGPGLLFIILGLGLMSLLSHRFAHYLDQLEQRIKTWIAKWKR